MDKNIEELKQKYKKLWDEIRDEKLFLEAVRLKERQNKLREKIIRKSEEERRKEARALIIFAKLVIKNNRDFTKGVMRLYANEFKQKEKGQEIDYSVYVKRLIEEIEEKERREGKG